MPKVVKGPRGGAGRGDGGPGRGGAGRGAPRGGGRGQGTVRGAGGAGTSRGGGRGQAAPPRMSTRQTPTDRLVSDLSMEDFLRMVREVVREEQSARDHSDDVVNTSMSGAASSQASTSVTSVSLAPISSTTPGNGSSAVLPSTSTPGRQLGSLPPLSVISSIPLYGGPPCSTVSLPALLPTVGTAGLSHVDATINPIQSGDMSLSMSTRPVPARLVSLIRSGRFVEMRDLLGDNATVRSHFEVMHGSLGVHLVPVSSRPRVREVPNLPSWVCCFLTFLAVATTDPVTRNRLSYAILLIREAMRHGGLAWMDYDRLFRQQAAIDPSLSWNTIHPGLQATTILSQRSAVSAGTFCNLCREPDHVATQCALAQLQEVTMPSRSVPGPSGGRAPQRRICSSWNEGSCIYPGSCSYRHVCSNCFHPSHKAKDCRSASRGRGSSTATTSSN